LKKQIIYLVLSHRGWSSCSSILCILHLYQWCIWKYW